MDLSTREGRRQQGERMKRAAHEAGLTLDELARQIGCSRALMFQYASGASLAQSDRLQQIAQAVGRPLAWFFEEGDSSATRPPGEDPARAAEQAELQAERERLTAERSRFEQKRASDDIARLEALLAAYASPPDPRKVVDICHQLYPLLAHDEDPQRLAGMLLKQGNALIQLQEWGAAKEKLEQAGALFREAGKLVSARDCLQSLGHVNLMLGRVDEALQQFESVASGDDWANRWQGTLSIGAAHEVLGDYPAAIAAFERALEIVEERAEAQGADAARLYIEANWSNLELDFGDYKSALQRSQRCIRMALRLGLQDQYMEALLTNGVVHLQLNDRPAAAHSIQQALDVADLTADQQHRSLALSYLSLCDTARHRVSEAIAGGKEALALALRCSAVRAEIAAQRALSEAYLLAENPAEALYHAQQGLIVALNIRVRLPQAQFGVLKGKARLLNRELEEAMGETEAALALATELHARPVQLDCHLTLAEAALGRKMPEAALQHARTGVEIADSARIPHIAWQGYAMIAEAEIQLQRVAEAAAAFQEAITGLRADRARQQEIGEEDTLMEDTRATELWRSWLRFTVDAEGADQARARAIDADWPPLLDWLDSFLQAGDGKADA